MPLGRNFECWRVRLTNTGAKPRKLDAFTYVEYAGNWSAYNDLVNLQYSQHIVKMAVEDGIIDHGTNVNFPPCPIIFRSRTRAGTVSSLWWARRCGLRHRSHGVPRAVWQLCQTRCGRAWPMQQFPGRRRQWLRRVADQNQPCTGRDQGIPGADGRGPGARGRSPGRGGFSQPCKVDAELARLKAIGTGVSPASKRIPPMPSSTAC